MIILSLLLFDLLIRHGVATCSSSTSPQGETWYKSDAPNIDWEGVASDASGKYQIAAAAGSPLYLSQNYGRNWTTSSSASLSWTAVASDSTGRFLFAATSDTGIYRSNNSGVSWTAATATSPLSINQNWYALACSASGLYAVVVARSSTAGGIYYSNNYGVTWSASNAAFSQWESVTMSSNGAIAYALSYTLGVYKSTNFGATWSKPTNLAASAFESITTDGSGQHVVVASEASGLYYSSNADASWTQSGVTITAPWQIVSMDTTGTYVYAAADAVTIYMSSDGGACFYPTLAPPATWYALHVSGAGQHVTAAVSFGGIYTMNFEFPTSVPTSQPSGQPAGHPTSQPTRQPSSAPSCQPSSRPSAQPVGRPTSRPSAQPQASPTSAPSTQPTGSPTVQPTSQPSSAPTGQPVSMPTSQPSGRPSAQPTAPPSSQPSGRPSTQPSHAPTSQPSRRPSSAPTRQPVSMPTSQPSDRPSAQPTTPPSSQPSGRPSTQPSHAPSAQPSRQPSRQPTGQPSSYPTISGSNFETIVAVKSFTSTYTSQLLRLGHNAQVYVTANLLLSFLSEESGGYITITAGQPGSPNAVTVSSNCAPQTACSTAAVLPSTMCAVNIDVTNALTPDSGGTLMLTASSDIDNINGATPTLCNRQGQTGIYFELNYTVSTFIQPTQRPTAAPTHAPTNGFSISLDSKSLATEDGAPFYVVAFAAAAYTALAVFLVRLHDGNDKLTPRDLVSVCSDLGLQGYGMVSEIFFIVLLFQAESGSYAAMATVMIVARLSNLVAAVFLLRRVFPPVDSVSPYNNLYDKEVLFDNANLYSALLMLMALDVSTFRYFPWTDTDFAFRTAGFPELLSFQVCMSTKVVTGLVSLIVQSVVLGSLNQSGINNKYTLALFILYLIMTIIMFLMTCLTIGMQIRLLRLSEEEALQQRNLGGNRGSTFKADNPLHNVNIEMGDLRTLGATRGSASDSFWQGRTSSRASSSTAGGESSAGAGAGAASATSASGRRRQKAPSTAPELEERVALLSQEVQSLRGSLQDALNAQQEQVSQLQQRLAALEAAAGQGPPTPKL